MNLNIYIARSGYCSRRKASLLIKDGKVKIDGVPVREPWYDVNESNLVTVNDRLLAAEKHVYLIFNKPCGVVSTVSDRFATTKVVDFVPKSMGRLFPVGRLDRDSSGLMILTNDGELCHRLTHPKFEVEKEYVVTISGRAEKRIVDRLIKGVREGGDILRVRSAMILSTKNNRSVIRAIICEGKKRHLRRLFSELGFNVVGLRRVRIGSLNLGALKEGQYRMATRQEIYKAGGIYGW